MALVVDASVAVKFLVREHDTDRARELLTDPDSLIAPDFILVEAASTFWKKVKRSELLIVHAEQHLRDLPSFFEMLTETRDLVAEAFLLSIRLKHPVYDCLYMALAIREDAMLVTADEGLVAAMRRGGMSEQVRLL